MELGTKTAGTLQLLLKPEPSFKNFSVRTIHRHPLCLYTDLRSQKPMVSVHARLCGLKTTLLVRCACVCVRPIYFRDSSLPSQRERCTIPRGASRVPPLQPIFVSHTFGISTTTGVTPEALNTREGFYLHVMPTQFSCCSLHAEKKIIPVSLSSTSLCPNLSVHTNQTLGAASIRGHRLTYLEKAC